MGDASTSSELADPVVVDFPLRGEWIAYHTPAARIPSHGTDMLGQRYAYDFIRLDRPGGRYHPSGTARTLLTGVPTSECYGWGEPIHAPIDGEVVAAADGLAERGRIHPIVELGYVLRTALTFKPTDEGLRRVMGNYVILRGTDVYAGFAHMTTGSVGVAVGQQVSTGDVLGLVGHTGNSTAPHLHFQLMDGADPRTARGVACAFRSYEVLHDGAWVPVERSIPTNTEQIRSTVVRT